MSSPEVKGLSFAISEQDAQTLARIVQEYGVRTVLEFGPGVSTEVFLKAGCMVDSYECDQKWLDHWREVLGVLPRLCLNKFGAEDFPIRAHQPAKRWDLAFIDSPPGHYLTVSRLNSALFALPRCRLLAVHDSKRGREIQLVAVLKDLGCTVRAEFDTERGICLLDSCFGSQPVNP